MAKKKISKRSQADMERDFEYFMDDCILNRKIEASERMVRKTRAIASFIDFILLCILVAIIGSAAILYLIQSGAIAAVSFLFALLITGIFLELYFLIVSAIFKNHNAKLREHQELNSYILDLAEHG